MYTQLSIEVPKGSKLTKKCIDNAVSLPSDSGIKLDIIDLSSGGKLININISLNYREDLLNFIKLNKDGKPVSICVPDILPNVLPLDEWGGGEKGTIKYWISDYFPNEIPFISHWHRSMIRPWKTWNALLLELSKENRIDRFTSFVANFIYSDCVSFAKAKNVDDLAKRFYKELDIDIRDFMVSVLKNDGVDYKQVIEYADLRVRAGVALNSINK